MKCLVCAEVAEVTMKHGDCGVLFCIKCITTRGRDEPCPKCKEENPIFQEDILGKFTD
jgi:hypothetical protein